MLVVLQMQRILYEVYIMHRETLRFLSFSHNSRDIYPENTHLLQIIL